MTVVTVRAGEHNCIVSYRIVSYGLLSGDNRARFRDGMWTVRC